MWTKGKVILLMYDNPVVRPISIKQAERFRKEILRMGFLRLQKSVYVKIIRNKDVITAQIKKVKEIAPEMGDIKILIISLGAFKELINVQGEEFNMKLFADEVITL